MVLVLIAIIALVLLTALDADLWPRMILTRKAARGNYLTRRCASRVVRRPFQRHAPQRGVALGLAFARRGGASTARWWWE